MAVQSQRGPLALARRRIDALDRRIARLLARRLRLVEGLAPLKERVRDVPREAAVLDNVRAAAGRKRVSREFCAEVYCAVLRVSRRHVARRCRRI